MNVINPDSEIKNDSYFSDDMHNIPNSAEQKTFNDKLLEIKNIKRNYWKHEEEELLKEWADKSLCYEWMHFKTHEKYKFQNTWFTIPVIVLSTITGTANFAQERFDDKYKDAVIMTVGGLNIIAGIITTIYQYLKISELNENHKIAYSEWGKLYRNIKTELIKHPFDREDHNLFMLYSKKEYERLINSSPSIPKDIVSIFNKTHKNIDINKPEICNSVQGTTIYNMDNDERKNMINELHEDITLREQIKDEEISKLSKDITNLHENYNNLKKKNDELVNKIKSTTINKDENLEKFKHSFIQINGRTPTNEEINILYKKINNNIDDNIPNTDTYINNNAHDNISESSNEEYDINKLETIIF